MIKGFSKKLNTQTFKQGTLIGGKDFSGQRGGSVQNFASNTFHSLNGNTTILVNIRIKV